MLEFARPGPIAIVTVSPAGAALAVRVAQALPEAKIWGSKPFLPQVECYTGSLKEFLGTLWPTHAAVICIMASGIVVRSIAPWVASKYSDPAVVVVDDAGRFAISLLSGHEGHANRLTDLLSEILGALPVVTTGTESHRRVVAGVGCRRGTACEDILNAIDITLSQAGKSRADLYALATIDLKADEPGLLQAARLLGVPLRVIPRSRIAALQQVLREPTFAEQITGVASVCVPAALLASPHSSLLAPKTTPTPGVTIALSEDTCGAWASAPADETTSPPPPKKPSEMPM